MAIITAATTLTGINSQNDINLSLTTGTYQPTNGVLTINNTGNVTGDRQSIATSTFDMTTTGAQFNWTNGELYMRTTLPLTWQLSQAAGSAPVFNLAGTNVRYYITNTNQFPFFQARNRSATIATLTNSVFSAVTPAALRTGTAPGLNITGLDADNSDLSGLVLDGWWLNTPGGLTLLGVDFSNIGRRQGGTNDYTHRIGPPQASTVRTQFLSGDFSGGVTELFNTNVNSADGRVDAGPAASNFDVFVIESVGPANSGNTLQFIRSLSTVTANAASNQVRLMTAWRPRMIDAGFDVVPDGSMKFDSSSLILYNVPSGALGPTVVPAITSTGAVINPDGFYFQNATGTITGTSGQTAATGLNLAYQDISADQNYVMSSYTHLIDNNDYVYPFMRTADARVNGKPQEFDSISCRLDSLIQGVAFASAPSATTAVTTFNGAYQFWKSFVHGAANRFEFNDVFSGVTNNGFTTVHPLNLGGATSAVAPSGPATGTTIARLEAHTADIVDNNLAGSLRNLTTTNASGITFGVSNVTGIVAPDNYVFTAPLITSSGGTHTNVAWASMGTIVAGGTNFTDSSAEATTTIDSLGTLTRSTASGTVITFDNDQGLADASIITASTSVGNLSSVVNSTVNAPIVNMVTAIVNNGDNLLNSATIQNGTARATSFTATGRSDFAGNSNIRANTITMQRHSSLDTGTTRLDATTGITLGDASGSNDARNYNMSTTAGPINLSDGITKTLR